VQMNCFCRKDILGDLLIIQFTKKARPVKLLKQNTDYQLNTNINLTQIIQPKKEIIISKSPRLIKKEIEIEVY